MSAPSFQEIKDRLLDNIETLARELVQDGWRSGAYWIGSNPARADRHPGSFWIRLRAPARGAWRDEAGVRGVDEGDVIDLVRYVNRLEDAKAARDWAARWLGMPTGGQAAPRDQAAEARRRAELEQKRRAEEAREAETRQDNRKRAFGLWLNAPELKPDTFPGSVLDTYLKSRAIDLTAGLIARGRPLPGALRFFAEHDYRTADGELIGLPCLVALMTGADGKPTGIHRTWLKPDGTGKAELPEPKKNKPRKIWPAGWTGGFVRIAKGAGDLSPEEACRRGRSGPLVVAEGIEDALTLALALPDRRVWAAGTLGNIGNVPPLSCISSVTVAADNDWGKGQAEAALEAALRTLRERFRKVHVARSPCGKDFNDLAKGETG